MTRSRRFCPYCGQMIDARSTACRRHQGLAAVDPHLDGVPADPLESLPLMAADIVQGEDSQTPEGKVSWVLSAGHIALLALPLAWLLGFASGRRRWERRETELMRDDLLLYRLSSGRRRRRGGSLRQRVSRKPRATATYTRPLTPFPAVSFSSSGELGNQLAGSEILRQRFAANRRGERSSSGDATEDLGANGARRPAAISAEPPAEWFGPVTDPTGWLDGAA